MKPQYPNLKSFSSLPNSLHYFNIHSLIFFLIVSNMSFNDFDSPSDNGDTANTTELDAARNEAGKPKPEQNFTGAPADAAEAEAKAREHNWPQKMAYDYSLYNPTKDAPIPENLPAWACNAVKYEWDDDFGDVPDRVPALEEELFNFEFLHREGQHMNVYQIDEVKQECPTEVKPVLKVCLRPSHMEVLLLK
jgi:hypothetical protein